MKTWVFMLLMLAATTQAQIVITADQFTSRAGKPMFSVEQWTDDSLVLKNKIVQLESQTGTGQTWDVSQLKFMPGTDTMRSTLIEGLGQAPTPYLPFKSANYVMEFDYLDDKIWQFIGLTDTAFLCYGYVFNSDYYAFDPAFLAIKFPMTFGSIWESRSKYLFSGMDSVFYSSLFDWQMNHVDGEGTLVLPGGTSVPCLRVKTTHVAYFDYPYEIILDTAIDYTFVDARGVGIASFSAGYSGVMTSYQSSAHVSVQQPVAPSSAVDRIIDTDVQILTVASNPVTTQLKLRYDLERPQTVSLQILDVRGNIVYTSSLIAEAGGNRSTIDINHLAAGGYIACIRTEHGIASAKFVKL